MKNLNSLAPLVSVLIPAYNAASLIEEALNSVHDQIFQDFEIIVVDDGSHDNTKEVVDLWLERVGLRGQCIRQKNKKIAGARNTGINAAAGKYIALLDHDDLWMSNKLEVVMTEFSTHPEVDLICHNENIMRDRMIVSVSRNGPAAKQMYENLLFRGNALSPSASVFKREVALAIGGFRENPEFNTVEDYDFWMRLSRIARFHFLNKVLGVYRLVEGSASRDIIYHHTNLEHLLNDHFTSYYMGRPGMKTGLRMRRRIADVYRSALGKLMQYKECPVQQTEYVIKILKIYPFSMKNVIRIVQWFFGTYFLRYK